MYCKWASRWRHLHPRSRVFWNAFETATKAAIARMNISSPTPIQEKAIPSLMAGRDLIGQARTGSGKTLAFAVPLIERCDPSFRGIQALVLVPTRELAIQVAAVVEALASSQQLRVILLYGGRSLRPEYAALRNRPHIVIATPGPDIGPSTTRDARPWFSAVPCAG